MVTEAPKLLAWARSLQALAQSGLAYDPSTYDGERYIQVRRVAAEMLAHPNELDASDPRLRRAAKVVFLCELVDAAQQTPEAEILEARFFSRDELPGLRYSRASAWQLDRCFAHFDDPGLPTEFD